mmetsp:Transcript_3771/g.3692  ORF Transcript_3771/g.3692 Transcript_3771/m.3692 type:complete len:94 (-) Transcript_3771:961-1242(-)
MPERMPSNDCLLLILSFVFDKNEARLQNLGRINTQARQYFTQKERDPLKMFVRPKKEIIINYHTDSMTLSKNLPKIAEYFEMSVIFNQNFGNW